MTHAYPVRVQAHLDQDLSRWLWLFKWLLAVPHYIVLAFLWIAFVVLSFVALVAIVVTGRYPRAIFEFNVGVLRWSWRVAYYAYGALGTDRYPPFTLADVPDYPATVEIAYPAHLSRGLALVKWWLLALPHYLVVAFFVGGGTYVAWNYGDAALSLAGGLVGLCVLFAALALLFTGRYPQGLFDFVLGMNRWVLRVAAYATLMTDEYPPFRFDAGGTEPALVSRGGAPDDPPGPLATAPAAAPASPAPAPPPPRPWTAGRVVAIVLGSIVTLVGLGVTLVGAGALWFDAAQRDDTGYVTTESARFESTTYAIRSESFRLDGVATWSDIVGTVRLHAVPVGDEDVFVGIGSAADVTAYLAGVEHDVVVDVAVPDTGGVGLDPSYARHDGDAPMPPEQAAQVWDASVSGSGDLTLDWTPRSGSWSVVVMNADASRDVTVDLTAAAEIPALDRIGVWIFVGGAVILVLGIVLVAVVATRRT